MSDERLLADLGRALPPDPAPPGLADRADALFAVRDLDGGLAELLEPEAAEPAGVRGGEAGTDHLTFEIGAVTLELTVGQNRITGRVLAAGPWTVTLEHPSGEVASAPAGELGDFAFEATVEGPIRLRLNRPAGASTRTDWFLA